MKFHAGFDLNGVIHRGDAAKMAGYVYFPGHEDPATEAEIIAHAAILRAQGYVILPACANHDRLGYCKGH